MMDKYITKQVEGTTSYASLYTVPDTNVSSAVISTFVICNRAATSEWFSARIRVAGATADDKQIIFHETPISGKSTVTATLGITLNQTDIFEVQVKTNDTISFTLFGIETRTP